MDSDGDEALHFLTSLEFLTMAIVASGCNVALSEGVLVITIIVKVIAAMPFGSASASASASGSSASNESWME